MNHKELSDKLLRLSHLEQKADTIATKLPYVKQMQEITCAYVQKQYMELGFTQEEVYEVINQTCLEYISENLVSTQTMLNYTAAQMPTDNDQFHMRFSESQ